MDLRKYQELDSFMDFITNFSKSRTEEISTHEQTIKKIEEHYADLFTRIAKKEEEAFNIFSYEGKSYLITNGREFIENIINGDADFFNENIEWISSYVSDEQKEIAKIFTEKEKLETDLKKSILHRKRTKDRITELNRKLILHTTFEEGGRKILKSYLDSVKIIKNLSKDSKDLFIDLAAGYKLTEELGKRIEMVKQHKPTTMKGFLDKHPEYRKEMFSNIIKFINKNKIDFNNNRKLVDGTGNEINFDCYDPEIKLFLHCFKSNSFRTRIGLPATKSDNLSK